MFPNYFPSCKHNAASTQENRSKNVSKKIIPLKIRQTHQRKKCGSLTKPETNKSISQINQNHKLRQAKIKRKKKTKIHTLIVHRTPQMETDKKKRKQIRTKNNNRLHQLRQSYASMLINQSHKLRQAKRIQIKSSQHKYPIVHKTPQ